MTDILATWSPCCRILRPGRREPGVMHSGLCQDRNGGSLGPTIHLVDAQLCATLNNDLTACQLEAGALKALNLRLHLRCDAIAYLHYGPAAPREAVAGDLGV